MPRPIPADVTPPVIFGIAGCGGCEGVQCKGGEETIGGDPSLELTMSAGDQQTLTVEDLDSDLPCDGDFFEWIVSNGTIDNGDGGITGLSVVYTAPDTADTITVTLYVRHPDHEGIWQGIECDSIEIEVGDSCVCTGIELIEVNGEIGNAVVDKGSSATLTIRNKDLFDPCNNSYTWYRTHINSYISPTLGSLVTFVASATVETGIVSLYCGGNPTPVDQITIDVVDPSTCNCSGVETIWGDTDNGRFEPGGSVVVEVHNRAVVDPCDLEYTWTITSSVSGLAAALSFPGGNVGWQVTIFHDGVGPTGLFEVHLFCKGIEVSNSPATLLVAPCYCSGVEHLNTNAPSQVGFDVQGNITILNNGLHPQHPCDGDEDDAYVWSLGPTTPNDVTLLVDVGNPCTILSGFTEGTISLQIHCHGVLQGVVSIDIVDCQCSDEYIVEDGTTDQGPFTMFINTSIHLRATSKDPANPCSHDDYDWIFGGGSPHGYFVPGTGIGDEIYFHAQTAGQQTIGVRCKGVQTDTCIINIQDTVNCGGEWIQPSTTNYEGYTGGVVTFSAQDAQAEAAAYTWHLLDTYSADPHTRSPSSGYSTVVTLGPNYLCNHPIIMELRCDGLAVASYQVGASTYGQSSSNFYWPCRSCCYCGCHEGIGVYAGYAILTGWCRADTMDCYGNIIIGGTGVCTEWECSNYHFYPIWGTCAGVGSASAFCANRCGSATQTSPGSGIISYNGIPCATWFDNRTQTQQEGGCCPDEIFPGGTPGGDYDLMLTYQCTNIICGLSSQCVDTNEARDGDWDSHAHHLGFGSSDDYYKCYFPVASYGSIATILKKVVRFRFATSASRQSNNDFFCYLQEYQTSGWKTSNIYFKATSGCSGNINCAMSKVFTYTSNLSWSGQYVIFSPTGIYGSPYFDLYEVELDIYYELN